MDTIGQTTETTKQAGKFAVVGILNTTIDYLVLNLLVFFGFTAVFVILGQKFLVANLISVFVAMINSFILNKQWTFQSKGGNIYIQILKFVLITAIGMFVVHQIVFSLFYYDLPSISALVFSVFQFLRLDNIFSDEFIMLNFAKSIAIVVSLIWNFVGYKFFVFKR